VVTICTAQWSLYVPHSGHCMYRTVVTICTAQWSLYVPHNGHYMYASLTFSNTMFCPHSVFMCFVWISEQTAIISLYSIKWLDFITEMQCVHCKSYTKTRNAEHIKLQQAVHTVTTARAVTLSPKGYTGAHVLAGSA